MTDLESSEFTIGHWRQAVESFQVLLPDDRYDWTQTSSGIEGVSQQRNLVITQAPLDPSRDNEQITALANIGVLYTDTGRLGFVNAWLSRSEHGDIGYEADPDVIISTAIYKETVALNLDIPEIPTMQSAPANIQVGELIVGMGNSRSDAERVVMLASRAAKVITALSIDEKLTDTFDIPDN